MTPANHLNLEAPMGVRPIERRALTIGVVVGLASLILAFAEPDKFFHAYLIAFMAWLGISLGCMVFLMIYHLTGGVWGTVVRRSLEAGVRTIWFMAVLFIPIAAGMKHIYFWLTPANVAANKHLVDLTHSYLTHSGFILRAVIYFVIWIGLSWLLLSLSATQDKPPVRNLSPRFRVISGPGLILYAFTVTFAVIDWVMSLSAPWISTIYGFIFIVGQCLAAISFIVIVETVLIKYEPFSKVLKPKEIHDHGKLMLTFIMLWAYFSFSQLLITWAGNLPSEITWFTRRLYHGWQYVGLFLVLFHFAVPFALLLSRPLKRNPRRLVKVAIWLIIARYVDLFWCVEGNFSQSFFVTLPDILLPIALGGLWVWMYFRNLRQAPLLPLYAHHTQTLLESVHE
ncbi:MAG TPA: hypothetical protein VN669_02150 [Candidatus Acidoferrales bacterium]|jgi:hypothetical protein|nr:hypothetical protein [Candidatus Acidoferrales bacterium]